MPRDSSLSGIGDVSFSRLDLCEKKKIRRSIKRLEEEELD